MKKILLLTLSLLMLTMVTSVNLLAIDPDDCEYGYDATKKECKPAPTPQKITPKPVPPPAQDTEDEDTGYETNYDDSGSDDADDEEY